MHRIQVGGDSMGLLAAVAAVVVCVLGIREAGWFLILSLLAGLLAAAAFRFWFRRRPSDIEPLSLTRQSEVAVKSEDRVEPTTNLKAQRLSGPTGVNEIYPRLSALGV
jgi:hypothetical protein